MFERLGVLFGSIFLYTLLLHNALRPVYYNIGTILLLLGYLMKTNKIQYYVNVTENKNRFL